MEDRRIVFLRELRQLMIRHRVAFTSEDHYPGYPECGEDIRISADFEWSFGVDDDTPIPEDVDLGQCFNPEDIAEAIININREG